MKHVAEIAAEIVAREGGFVNDPDDPGGATKHGVTLATLRRLGIDVTGDGRTDLADVRALTPAQAADIYVEHYFRRPGLDALPEPLQASVFDMQVNAGANAVKVLQRLLTDMGYPCDPDGQVGHRPSARRNRPIRRRRRIWPTLTGLRGGITITPLPMRAPRRANMPAAATVAKVAGSSGLRSSLRRNIT
jgi:Glycosyl hydrolase 108